MANIIVRANLEKDTLHLKSKKVLPNVILKEFSLSNRNNNRQGVFL